MTEPAKYTTLQRIIGYPLAYLIIGILAVALIAIALVPAALLGGQLVVFVWYVGKAVVEAIHHLFS
jgi:hypothetical protein